MLGFVASTYKENVMNNLNKCIEFSYSFDVKNPDFNKIVEIEAKIDLLRDTWRRAEAKRVLESIRADEKAPKLLLKLLEYNEISHFNWGSYTISSDYMPDTCYYLAFVNKNHVCTLIIDTTNEDRQEAIDFGLIESEDITEEEFKTVISKRVLDEDYIKTLSREDINAMFEYLRDIFICNSNPNVNINFSLRVAS